MKMVSLTVKTRFAKTGGIFPETGSSRRLTGGFCLQPLRRVSECTLLLHMGFKTCFYTLLILEGSPIITSTGVTGF